MDFAVDAARYVDVARCIVPRDRVTSDRNLIGIRSCAEAVCNGFERRLRQSITNSGSFMLQLQSHYVSLRHGSVKGLWLHGNRDTLRRLTRLCREKLHDKRHRWSPLRQVKGCGGVRRVVLQCHG